MKKTKNNYDNNKNKIKYDKNNTRKQKSFRNRCMINDNTENEATNREIYEKVEIESDKN
jgi:hypothetical protein